jgi:uncharacterized protein YjiS (DUF1127 family)
MIKTIAKKFDNWRTYNRTVRELNALDNRQLSDLGITRGDIVNIARRHVIYNM